MDESQDLHVETLAAQAGLKMHVGETVSTSPPISASTTFTGESVRDVHAALGPQPVGYAYSRNANPTVAAFEEAIARLYRADGAVAFGSGMAAMHAAISSLGLWPGDRIVAGGDLYGVTRSLLGQFGQYEIETMYVDVCDLDALRETLASASPRLLCFESITNPLLHVADIEAVAQAGHEAGAAVLIDNTFATPYLSSPLAAGVDLVVDSATKYIAGHGDVTCGVVTAQEAVLPAIRNARNVMGGVLSPFEAWLAMRGMRTLPLRMERHCANALALAHWLEEQSWVERVHYPGLPGHPQREVAARQFGGKFGGMVAFELDGERERVLAFMDCLELVTPGTSLGDVESLALYPPLSSHRTLTPEQLAASGIGEGLVRLSAGIEHVDDLKADLSHAAIQSGLLS